MHERPQCHSQRRAEKLGAKLFLDLIRWTVLEAVHTARIPKSPSFQFLPYGLSFKDGEILLDDGELSWGLN